MMNKKMVGLVILLLVVCMAFSGCQLALKDGTNISKEDELKGVYITFKPLPSKEDELSDRDIENIINGKNITKDNSKERFFATAEKVKEDGHDTTNFKFVGIDGIPFFDVLVYEKNADSNYIKLISGPEISDHNYSVSVNVGDNLEGTIYIDSTLKGEIYCNPVFETSKGEIYMTHANCGVTISGGYTQDLSETATTTVNGKTTSVTTKIKIKLQTIDPNKTIILKQFSAKDEFLSSTTITQKSIPKFIKKDAKTEYMIAETHGLNSEKKYKISREFVDLSEDTYNCIFLNSKGFGIPYPVEIK